MRSGPNRTPPPWWFLALVAIGAAAWIGAYAIGNPIKAAGGGVLILVCLIVIAKLSKLSRRST